VKLLEEKNNTAISLKNILFATDFSEVSETALPYAAAMSFRYGGMVHLVHALPEIDLVHTTAIDPATVGSFYEDTHSDAQEKMQDLSLRLRGLPHHTYIRRGKVGEVLSGIIHEHKVDMLIAGTHGRTGLGKLLLGSVAEEVFRSAVCPVFTVGPKVPRPQRRCNSDIEPASIEARQILYATDFSSQSLAAASYAFSLAQEFRSRLILLHVIQEYGEDLHERPGPIDTALRKLEELQSEHADLRWSPEAMVEFGSPSDHILRTAAERDIDLIVLGARPGHVEAATHLPWATAHQVVARANCPVLTVRDRA